MRALLRLFACASAAVVAAGAALDIEAARPPASSWKRTRCGSLVGSTDMPTKWGLAVKASEQPLVAYPRPQMVRSPEGGHQGPRALSALRDGGDPGTWTNLNGLWEWEAATSDVPAHGRTLNGSILVPFPVESCLSGVAPQKREDIVQRMWYRLTFDFRQEARGIAVSAGDRTLLHFGAVDWQASVYLNGALLGNHTGGYDGFSFDITGSAKAKDNELLVYVYDPSDGGVQPHGKQRTSAHWSPGGDTYTPSSGIWQTVWLEIVPRTYISSLKINQASLSSVSVEATIAGEPAVAGLLPGAGEVEVRVLQSGSVLASGRGPAGSAVVVDVPSPSLWSPDAPHLYDMTVSAGHDTVISYFGLRTFGLGVRQPGSSGSATRPLLNGNFTFMAGFLDQSWWPDGQYTAPSDDALEYDLIATKMFGLNMIRLHQKVNPERWYYHADRHGVVLFQDMPQKYGHATSETIPFFLEDMKSMISGRGNHPCIVQWTTFNEGDCVGVFQTPPSDVKSVTGLVKQWDPTRLVDTNSGGPANNLHVADVNDIHSYPYPGDPKPSASQYAMVGEFGGLGAFIPGKEWVPGKCYAYLEVANGTAGAAKYVEMARSLLSRADHISASVYTQTTDVELECDGFLNYDRTNKFSDVDTAAIRDANRALTQAACRYWPGRLDDGSGAASSSAAFDTLLV